MPCNSDHMNPTSYELELSRVACLLDELAGLPQVASNWLGYHHKVYNKSTKELGDRMVSELCDALQTRDVTQYSLEMQVWWRDHQAADKARLAEEMRKHATAIEIEAALAKLNSYERKLLGI